MALCETRCDFGSSWFCRCVSVVAALRRSCVSAASAFQIFQIDPFYFCSVKNWCVTSFRQLEFTSQCPFFRSPMACWSQWSPNWSLWSLPQRLCSDFLSEKNWRFCDRWSWSDWNVETYCKPNSRRRIWRVIQIRYVYGLMLEDPERYWSRLQSESTPQSTSGCLQNSAIWRPLQSEAVITSVALHPYLNRPIMGTTWCYPRCAKFPQAAITILRIDDLVRIAPDPQDEQQG